MSHGRKHNRRRWIFTKWPLDQYHEAPWDNALILLFLMPIRPLGLVHHFIGTNNAVIAQAQEIAEK